MSEKDSENGKYEDFTFEKEGKGLCHHLPAGAPEDPPGAEAEAAGSGAAGAGGYGPGPAGPFLDLPEPAGSAAGKSASAGMGTSGKAIPPGSNHQATSLTPPEAGADGLGSRQASGSFCCAAAAAWYAEHGKKKSWPRRHPFCLGFILLFLLFVVGNILGAVFLQLDGKGVFSGPRLGIIRIEGMILDSAPVVRWAHSLAENESVHGVLLFINSPGGGVVPSQEIHAAVKRLAATKPVVVYMSSAAASGGYYAAVGADYIVASPSTLTGSIGVRMDLVEMKELFDFLGIHPQGLASGPLKEAGTPMRPMRQDERSYLQGLVMDMYECFIEDIAKGRGLPLEKVRGLADGRAYTGRQALALGLVDKLGDSGVAVSELMVRAKMSAPPKEYLDGPPKKKSFLAELLSESLLELDGFAARSRSPLPGFYY